MNPVVIIHGGAWAIPDSKVIGSLVGVQNAARVAWSILETGGTSLDAVEAAVSSLEDDPIFDAGTGSVLTSEGTVELDAMIMEGSKLKCGAVACVQNIKNPVQLARLVMDQTDHILLVGKGANDFALENNIKQVQMEELVTKEAIEEWETYKKYKNTVTSLFSKREKVNGHSHNHDTVGCVAIDSQGTLACGTSTGGITAKRPGRVGDSPLIGSGGYADNESAAVSCTGYGESIAKVCLAKTVADGCANGLSPSESAKLGLNLMARKVGGAGGVICINKQGDYGFSFTSQRMAWAILTKEKAICGINPQEIIQF